MKTKAVRLYGVRDLRLEEFGLPEIKEDEILVKVMSGQYLYVHLQAGGAGQKA